jgi:ligand-binding sensor domain-containing protein
MLYRPGSINSILLTIFVWSTSLIHLNVYGQEPIFREIASAEKTGSNQINSILQDKEGFIWLGTDAGIIKFDGTEFKTLSLPANYTERNATAIGEDSKGNLWFGFQNGLILKYDGFEISEPELGNQFPKEKITAITEGVDGQVWIGTYGEGMLVATSDSVFLVNSNNGLSDNYIYCLLKDADGRIWSGTDNGINICHLEKREIFIDHLSVDDGLPDFIVKALTADTTGNIWIGMFDEGICRYNPNTKKFLHPYQRDGWEFGPVEDILISGDNLWISTDGPGIVEYDISDHHSRVFKAPPDVNLSRIHSLMHDREGNIWLISSGHIYFSLGNRLEILTSYQDYPISNIHAMFADESGNIWFANDMGLHRYSMHSRNDDNKLQLYLLDLDISLYKIMCLYRDPFGFIWAGTFGQGILRLDPETGNHLMITEKDGLINNNVLSIKATRNEIWFATLGGVSKCTISTELHLLNGKPRFINYGKDEGLINSYIYHLLIDPSDRIWLATDGSGVLFFEEGNFINISKNGEFDQKVIYSLAMDKNGSVWMNASREGLFKYNGHQIEKVITDDEHKNLSFSGILANPNNEMVITYDGGIDVMEIQTGNIFHYELNAGLQDINPDLNTLTSDEQGNIWIGTQKGIIKYAAHSKKNWSQPHPRISDVSVFLEKIDHQIKNEFKYSENHLAFNYTGLWYQYPEKVEYMIMLEGHDLNWIITKNKNVIYSNLKPGHYTFKVKTGLYGNYENSPIAAYSFEVKSPFWMKFWFWILIGIISGIAIFSVIKSREKRLRRKEELLRERIKFQFENLKSQINPHFLFNSFSTLIALIDQDKDFAISYVEELSNLFRVVLEYKDEDVISLKEELEIVDNYIKIQQKRYGENLVVNISKISEVETKKIPPLTLQLLIENAIKHNIVSKAYILVINVYGDDVLNYLYVENNLQEKKEAVQSTGIGIKNIIERYKLLSDKEVKIIKTEKNFKVGLPFLH